VGAGVCVCVCVGVGAAVCVGVGACVAAGVLVDAASTGAVVFASGAVSVTIGGEGVVGAGVVVIVAAVAATCRCFHTTSIATAATAPKAHATITAIRAPRADFFRCDASVVCGPNVPTPCDTESARGAITARGIGAVS